jgi:hypothetical protein
MENLEIQAEVYKVIRANMDKPKREILKKLYQHLKDTPKADIIEALNRLYRKAK